MAVAIARSWRRLTRTAYFYMALAFYMVIAVSPVFWMVLATVKDDYDLIDPKVPFYWFQRPLTGEHLSHLITHTNFPIWAANSFLIAVGVIVITLAVVIPGGYALARLRFAGAQWMGIGIFLTYLVPPALLFLPLATLVSGYLQLSNTKWALVLVYPTFTIPFCLWLMIGFFKRVPTEIEDAALVDGCNRWQAVTRVVLPVSIPGILTVIIFAFTLAMQDFLYALTFVSSSDQKPITLGVPTELIRGDVFFWGQLMAGALIPGVLVALLYNFFLDYFVEGITGGAIR